MPSEDDAGGRLAAAIRAARARKRWSRETLAHHSGLSWSAITQIETGRRTDVRVSSLVALASALDVSVDYLVGHSPPPLLAHGACLFGSDDELVRCVRSFADSSVGAEPDAALMVVATERNLSALKEALGDGPSYEEADGWYSSPGEAAGRYREFTQAARAAGRPWTRIVGEPVWLGRSRSETRAWTRYESLLNLSFASWPVSILCLYDTRALRQTVLDSAHCTHPQLVRDGVTADSNAYADPADFVTAEPAR